jgi:hypothetical protein
MNVAEDYAKRWAEREVEELDMSEWINMNCTVKRKLHFLNSSQNKGLSPSCIALSFDGFGSISWHCLGFFSGSFTAFHIFRISNFFGLSITEETLLVEMRIWCIKIGIVLV